MISRVGWRYISTPEPRPFPASALANHDKFVLYGVGVRTGFQKDISYPLEVSQLRGRELPWESLTMTRKNGTKKLKKWILERF
jgi:hypothetical protein